MRAIVDSPRILNTPKAGSLLSFNVYLDEGTLGILTFGWKIRPNGKLSASLQKGKGLRYYPLILCSKAACVEIYNAAKIKFSDAFPQFFPLDLRTEDAVKSAVYSNMTLGKALPSMVQQ